MERAISACKKSEIGGERATVRGEVIEENSRKNRH